MSENKLETVSSLVDNLASSSQLLNEVSQDQQLAQAWQRYHLIGDVMRGDTPNQLHLDLADNIAKAIADEPTVLAPQNQTSMQRFKAKVVPLFKPLGQMAVAASAAGLMILGVQQANVADNTNPVPNQVLQTRPLGGIADPVSFNVQQPSAEQQQQAVLEQQRRFQALLNDHQQQLKLNAQAKQAKKDDEEKSSNQ